MDMRTNVMVALISVITSTFLFASEKAQDRIPVFVKSGATASGFTDPSKDRQDSMKDLVKKLSDSKSVRPANSEEEAVLTLEVLGRDTKREANISTALFGSKQNKSYLTVRLTAGEYSAEFTGESGSKGMLKGYGAAALADRLTRDHTGGQPCPVPEVILSRRLNDHRNELEQSLVSAGSWMPAASIDSVATRSVA